MKADKISFSFPNSSWIVEKKGESIVIVSRTGRRDLMDEPDIVAGIYLILASCSSLFCINPRLLYIPRWMVLTQKIRNESKTRQEKKTKQPNVGESDTMVNPIFFGSPFRVQWSRAKRDCHQCCWTLYPSWSTHTHTRLVFILYGIYLNILKEWNERRRRRRRRRLNENLFALIPF